MGLQQAHLPEGCQPARTDKGWGGFAQAPHPEPHCASALLETLMTLFLEGPVLLDPSRAPYPAAGESSTPPWASQHKRRPLCPAVRRAWAVRLVTARLKDPLRVTGSLSSWLTTRAPLPHLQTALLCHPSMEAAWPLTTPEVSAKDKNDSAPLANGL